MAKYRGIAFPIVKGLGGIPDMAEDEELVWNDIKLLFNTKKRSRVMRMSFGMDLESLIFENTGDLLKVKIYREIATALANFEPRAILLSVDITDTKTLVNVDTIVSIKGIKKKISTTIAKSNGV